MAEPRRTKPLAPIIGKRFGMLTVIQHVPAADARAEGKKAGYYIARCDCGKLTTSRDATHFTSGRRQSCGCTVRTPAAIRGLDVTGQRYGMLFAIEPSHSEPGQGWWWRFQCDCGEVAHLRLKDVRHGNTASCGCLKNADKSNQWKKQPPILDINRPWRKAEQVDDRWLVLVGERAPRMPA